MHWTTAVPVGEKQSIASPVVHNAREQGRKTPSLPTITKSRTRPQPIPLFDHGDVAVFKLKASQLKVSLSQM